MPWSFRACYALGTVWKLAEGGFCHSETGLPTTPKYLHWECRPNDLGRVFIVRWRGGSLID